MKLSDPFVDKFLYTVEIIERRSREVNNAFIAMVHDFVQLAYVIMIGATVRTRIIYFCCMKPIDYLEEVVWLAFNLFEEKDRRIVL